MVVRKKKSSSGSRLGRDYFSSTSSTSSLKPSKKKVFFSPDKQDILIFKQGNTEKNVSLQQIRQSLTDLRKYADKEIKDIPANIKKDFDRMVHYVYLLYDTDHYSRFHTEVQRIFGDLDQIIPGTIGAYFGGCLKQTSLSSTDSTGCAAICAGSMPPPKELQEEKNWQFCQYPVLWATKDGKFIKLHQSESPSALIFFPVSMALTGLTETQKSELKKAGYDTVNLISVSSDGTDYRELYQGFMPIDQIPTSSALSMVSNPLASNAVFSSNNYWLLILLILLLVLGFWIGWKVLCH